MENAKQYHSRHLLRRDIEYSNVNGVGRLIGRHTHPSFTNLDDGEIRDRILRAMQDGKQDTVVIHAVDDNDDVKGFALAYVVGKTIGSKWLEIPIFIADDPMASDMLIDTIFSRHLRDNEFKKNMVYIRAHYDPVILKSLASKGFQVEPAGDMLLASYPKSNMRHKDLFASYDRPKTPEISPNNPESPENPDDEFGLFKDLPWQR